MTLHEFLVKHRAYRKFKRNAKYIHSKTVIENWMNMESSGKSYPIDSAFTWHETKEEHKYWRKLANKWRKL